MLMSLLAALVLAVSGVGACPQAIAAQAHDAHSGAHAGHEGHAVMEQDHQGPGCHESRAPGGPDCAHDCACGAACGGCAALSALVLDADASTPPVLPGMTRAFTADNTLERARLADIPPPKA